MKRSGVLLQRLAFEVLAAPAAASASSCSAKHTIETAVILHGILGNKKNLRTFAKELQKLRPNLQTVLLDHRGHGDSIALADGSANTVAACAHDLEETFASKDFLGAVFHDLDPNHPQQHRFVPDMLCAHSFGGKVALQYYQNQLHAKSQKPSGGLKDIWVLDASPFKYPASVLHDSSAHSVAQVIDCLIKAPRFFPHRNAAQQYLTETAHLPLSLAQWLSASMLPAASLLERQPQPSGDGDVRGTEVAFALDLGAVQSLFKDFVGADFDHFLREVGHKEAAHDTVVHFLRAEKNALWDTSGDWQRLREIAADAQRHHDHSTAKHRRRTPVDALEMQGVGHWLHAEQPAQLARLLHAHSAHSHHNSL